MDSDMTTMHHSLSGSSQCPATLASPQLLARSVDAILRPDHVFSLSRLVSISLPGIYTRPHTKGVNGVGLGPWYRAVLGLLPPNYENLLCRRLGVQSIWASPIDLLQPPAASVRVCSKISTSGSFPAADFRIALIGRMPQQLFVHLSSAPRCHDVALRRSPKLIMRSTHPPGSFCAPNLQARSMWASWAAGHQRVNHGLPLATWGLGQRLKTLPGDSRYRVSRAGFTGPHKCWLTGMAKKRDKPTELAEQGRLQIPRTLSDLGGSSSQNPALIGRTPAVWCTIRGIAMLIATDSLLWWLECALVMAIAPQLGSTAPVVPQI
ncbi:hypothetical protein DHEL01_v206901 [Diaporthe helianthi]|uniref:Uncharacterized protein n=1 Tax=Diaporthe helianthi TaxID=158607 RepID=A0A2P5HWR4_DIAHE|nr:hypothetical protein DHEL01_v206901 [Diaporthe helianthi]